jgi:DNA polymerase-3 subunit epsilon
MNTPHLELQHKTICFDVETTGLDYRKDEILSISILSGDGDVLFDEYIKPAHKTSWTAAQRVNGIAPEDVADARSIKDCRAELEEIFRNADVYIGYNILFDLGFIRNVISISGYAKKKLIDVMKEFAPLYGEYDSHRKSYKYQKLEVCAKYFNYRFQAHDSLEDAKATLYCYKQILRTGNTFATDITEGDMMKDTMPNPDISRFLEAQDKGHAGYEAALTEIKHGRKQSHWIWYIFPQLKGLGRSSTAEYYGIDGLSEAKAYLADATAGKRLVEISTALCRLDETDPIKIFGDTDAMKVKSCMTLFLQADRGNPIFQKVLDQYYGGQLDANTLSLLGQNNMEATYCGVEFPGGNKLYSYRTSDLKISVGDHVWVPVGEWNNYRIATVKTVDLCHNMIDTPFPYKKTKEIYRIATVEEANYALQHQWNRYDFSLSFEYDGHELIEEITHIITNNKLEVKKISSFKVLDQNYDQNNIECFYEDWIDYLAKHGYIFSFDRGTTLLAFTANVNKLLQKQRGGLLTVVKKILRNRGDSNLLTVAQAETLYNRALADNMYPTLDEKSVICNVIETLLREKKLELIEFGDAWFAIIPRKFAVRLMDIDAELKCGSVGKSTRRQQRSGFKTDINV